MFAQVSVSWKLWFETTLLKQDRESATCKTQVDKMLQILKRAVVSNKLLDIQSFYPVDVMLPGNHLNYLSIYLSIYIDT